MDDAISRSAVLDRLEMLRWNYGLKAGYRDAMTDAIGEVRNALTIDAVPVVRCKDCHFWTPSGVFGQYIIGGVYEYGRCPYFSETRECFYCQYGQKRTSNEEATK